MLHTFLALVQDKPGVLKRVASLFRRRVQIVGLIALFVLVGTTLPGAAKSTDSALTVAEANRQAESIGSRLISVRGHFWWGKEGSMVYDNYYKSILLVGYSNEFNAKHTYANTFGPDSGHKSNIATLTGHFEHEKNGKLYLIADDISFEK